MLGAVVKTNVTALGKFDGGVIARTALGRVVRRPAYATPVRGVEKRMREERSYWGKKSRARSARRHVN
jgi:hypothetical protein